MQVIEELNSENFVLYAFRNYNNPNCVDIEEFYDDLNRFKYLKKLINKYVERGALADRLILNHLIVLYNVFGIEAATKMVEYKMLQEHRPILKPFLLFLKYIKETDWIEIDINPDALDALKEI